MEERKVFKYTHGNSSDHYSQVNNERKPMVSCFNTSMIAVALDVMGMKPPTSKDKTGGYKQPEDQFDWYMHESPEVREWVDNYCKTSWVKTYLDNGGDIRELWEVEVYCFNKWIGKNVCKVNYHMSKHDFIEEIQKGHGVVTTGLFCRFKHAVAIVGFVAETDKIKEDVHLVGENASIRISNSCEEVKEIVFDDSFGSPLNDYKPLGANGDDVHMPANEFFAAINKDTNTDKGVYYGITFKS